MNKIPNYVSTIRDFTIREGRTLSTSSSLSGKKNFRKFLLYNKRGPILFKQQQISNPDPDLPIDKRGVRDTGYTLSGKYVEVHQKIPELIVPDLEGFKLKPYVSYKTAEVIQSEFTSRDLFDAIYSKKIIDDYNNGKLNADGSSKEPSAEEQLTSDSAWSNARKTGSDIF